MEQQLKAAQEDMDFQFFLSKSFGLPFRSWDGDHVVVGRVWRDIYFIERITKLQPGERL